jgi:hypothetical protein
MSNFKFLFGGPKKIQEGATPLPLCPCMMQVLHQHDQFPSVLKITSDMCGKLISVAKIILYILIYVIKS